MLPFHHIHRRLKLQMSHFHIKVEPEQDEFRIDTGGTYPRIRVQAPAEAGRANAELTARLSDELETDVGIVSGHRSRRKKIAVDMERDEALSRLS